MPTTTLVCCPGCGKPRLVVTQNDYGQRHAVIEACSCPMPKPMGLDLDAVLEGRDPGEPDLQMVAFGEGIHLTPTKNVKQ